MNSDYKTLNIKDISKGLVTAFISGAIIAVAGIVTQPGFHVLSADWSHIVDLAVSGGIATFVAYLVKNFFSTDDGKFMGRIG